MAKSLFGGSEYVLSGRKKQLRIFLSYGHDKNAVVVSMIKGELERRGHCVWMDQTDIHHGQDWREQITKGLVKSDWVISFMSRHTVRDRGVCLDELKIALCAREADLRTVLLEPEDEVRPPASLTSRQWLDMSEWEKHISADGKCLDNWFAQQVEVLCDSIESEEAEQFVGQIARLRDLLRPNLYESRRFRLVNRLFEGRQWLCENVKAWTAEPAAEKFFCIYGVPGAGKSTFLAHLMHYNPVFVGAVFFEWDEGGRDAVPAVIRSLAFQIASRLPDYRQQLLRALENHKDIDKYSESELFRTLLTDPLSSCIDGNRGTCLIAFDALDEALEAQPDSVAFLMAKLRDLPGWLRIIVTSRKINSVSSLLEDARHVNLDDACPENNQDIEKYVMRRLADVKGYHYGMTGDLILRAEGSFLYAELYCDGVLSGYIDPNDLQSMPRGLGSFYIQNFRRMFRDEQAYAAIRPAMELLICNDSIPSGIFRAVTGMDFYAFRDFRRKMGSFILEDTLSYPYTKDKLPVLKFVHKSVADWLKDPDRADRFCLDPMGGKVSLARYALLRTRENKRFVPKPQRYYGQCPQISVDLELDYLQERLGRFLTDGRLWKEYEQFLLEKDTPWLPYWREAGEFPAEYPIDGLMDRLRYGFRDIWRCFHEVSFAATAEFATMYDVMADVIHTPKSAEVFFEQLRTMSLSGFYRSSASECYDHRGLPSLFNADKIDTAYHVTRCIRKCQKLHIPIPKQCLNEAECIKLSCLYCEGRYDESIGSIYMNFPYFFRDNICVLDDEAVARDFNFRDVANIRREFNTYCLQEYLKGFGQDDDHVDQLIREHADLDTAANRLMPYLKKEMHKKVEPYLVNVTMGSAVNRLNYISYLRNRYSPVRKWHPRPAEHIRGLGALNDYCHEYRFPCCGRIVVTEQLAPTQYLFDGCEDMPL